MRVDPVKAISPLDAFIALGALGRPFILSGGGGWGNGGGGGKNFSFVGAGPFMEFTATPGGTFLDGEPVPGDPFEALSEILSGYKDIERGPFPFNGGGVGYFSYDLKDIIEKPRGDKGAVKGGGDDPTLRKGVYDPSTPLCSVGFYDPVYVYDHVDGKGFIVSAGTKGAEERVVRIKGALEAGNATHHTHTAPPASSQALQAGGCAREKNGLYPLRGAGGAGYDNLSAAGVAANFTRSGYIDAIKKAQSYIAAGDIYQINLSQRLTIPWAGDPFALYTSLLSQSPARFSSYIDMGSFKIISNTPERLLKVEDGTVETQPIKGTRPRGAHPEEDRRYMEELKKSEKERAEHVMVVDLERNDIGRVSIAGSVEVTDFEKIETYPGLHHMVSTVRGRLKPGLDGPMALRASFPGGSVTGTPKIRAMEIIEELEPAPRGIYTGGAGFMDFSGTMDISMAIRTAIYKDGRIDLNVGGGIVADSVAEEEYDETILKAMDFLNLFFCRR